jgi:serine/threonine-protein kinase RsbW
MFPAYIDIELPTQKIVLGSNLRQIAEVESLLDELKNRYAINEENFNDIWVALHEAVTNAIRHGNRFDPEKKVRLSVKTKEDRYLCFTVKDQGIGFDPDSLPDPTSPEFIEEPNGRGVFLIRRLADKVSYSDNGTHLEMCFDLYKN